MHITKMLFQAAGKELQWFGPSRLQPQEVAKLEYMAATYGKAVIESDFEAWAEEVRGQDLPYPVSAYIRIADNRLKTINSTTERENDSRIAEISAAVFSLTARTPHQADIVKLLEKYSDSEINEAFKKYVSNLDDFEMKFSIKNFFRDGGADGVILALRNEKKILAQQEIDVAASIAAGRAEFQKEKEERDRRIAEKDALAEKQKDNPFGGFE
jgi:hypothetical protein